jgi:glycogen debranching enzyme GlgX
MMTMTAGLPYPLGAHWTGGGVNFALAAPNAHAVHLCLFNAAGTHELARHPLPACTDGVWHRYLADAAPGLVYAYRVDGPWAPELGHRFNADKVLLDPYARAVVGAYRGQEGFMDAGDNAAIALKAQVVHDDFDWGADAPPRVAPGDTILYELHVKGFTKLHPGVPPALQGSYAGLAQPAVLDYLQRLGITTVNLMPVHFRADEVRLQQLGLSNYWGYSSIGFFAPEPRYWSGRPGTTPIGEFREMVKALHARGLEVVLDVVYNHTAETDEHGPTLSFRGIDNALYYHLQPENPALYENWTGCGNSLNLAEPRVVQLVMDSLRYWVQEMHVDGFRFDLAPELARTADGFSSSAAFLAAVRQDPVLARVKLIAEPWDIGPGGYQLGHFPPGWLEWNDQYRDTMRGFWLQSNETRGAFAQRFAGSSATFRDAGRQPTASVNFITAHDGFTLRDLVSYDHKHNDANGEQNRDGHGDNRSWNGGAEGPTDDNHILQRRSALQRALLATLLFSQGTPMLLAGDDIGHSQRGNNNAYCQDNAISWLDWEHADESMLAATRAIIALRQRYPALRHTGWHTSETIDWYQADGAALDDAAWNTWGPLAICLHPAPDSAACLLLFNVQAEAIDFILPAGAWRVAFNSADDDLPADAVQGRMAVPAHAVLLLVAGQENLFESSE